MAGCYRISLRYGCRFCSIYRSFFCKASCFNNSISRRTFFLKLYAQNNFEQAFDDDDRKMKPIDWDEQTPSAEELCQPPTEDEIDERGYTDETD